MYVLSMATDLTPWLTSQAAISSNWGVVAPKTRTLGRPSSPSGPHTQCRVAPMSIPATMGFTGSSLRRPRLLAFAFSVIDTSKRGDVRLEVATRLDSDLGESHGKCCRGLASERWPARTHARAGAQGTSDRRGIASRLRVPHILP